MTVSDQTKKRVIFQGERGANSHFAALEIYPDAELIPCETFEDAFAAIEGGCVDLGMIPIDNSVAGRVADIHHLMRDVELYIVGEHFLRVNHQLCALPGAGLDTIKTVYSHPHALGQCRRMLRALGLRPVPTADTAGAAREVAEWQDLSRAAICSRLAAELNGLHVLSEDIEDHEHNITRFIILAREPDDAESDEGPIVTSFVFRVRNVPAALYKALGGFATNGVNMTKLESYVDASFNVAQFYADIDGHPAERPVALALEELDFFTEHLRILGAYRASPMRENLRRLS